MEALTDLSSDVAGQISSFIGGLVDVAYNASLRLGTRPIRCFASMPVLTHVI